MLLMILRGSKYQPLKRGMDALGAGMGLILLAPLFLIVGIAIRCESPGPVFFRQQRAGQNGNIFRIFKLRTMYVDPQPAHGFQSKDDPRITRLGRWLRRWSIDELPQLINVLLGEMSLVGPRPALVHQIERYDEQQWRRLEVRPGISGWAQVNGRNTLTWEEKIELDLWYVDQYSLYLDLKILLMTIGAVLKASSIYFHGKGSAWRAHSAEQDVRHG